MNRVLLVTICCWPWLAGASGSAEEACASCHEQATLTGAHSRLSCTACHADARGDPHPEKLKPVRCASCHEAPAREYAQSVHGSARRNGVADSPDCSSCHGSAHGIAAGGDPASPVAKQNLAETCASCHADPDFLARHKIPFARPVEAYRLSVHGRAVAAGNADAPSCSSCHGSHGILPARDTRAEINHWKVPATCGACHDAVHATYAGSVHGQAAARGVAGAPVCTDCHGEHTILAPSEPGSLVNPARVSSVTCGRCHADERLAARYNLPRDKVPAFEDSFHGLALRSGSQTVANCASCHGVHNILPSSDRRSTVHLHNLARTCGTCHPGAGTRFAIGAVHVRPATVTEHAVVRWIRVFYLVLIPATLGFMLVHNGLDFAAKLVRGAAAVRSRAEVPRMNLNFRIAHGLVALSFPVLVWTGFALAYPEAWWAAPLLRFEGEVAFRGTVHRLAGLVLIAALSYHVVHLILVPRDRIILRHLWPRARDLRDVLGLAAYNLGRRSRAPRFSMFSYAEKAEYLAFFWGSAIMVASGLLLWFNDWSLRSLPKWMSDAATAVHWYEAILAALSILVWHLYMVVFDPDVYPMDRSWITGSASADHMRRSRPAYLRWVQRGRARGEPPRD